MSNPIVTSLPEYIDQNRLPLISKTMLGAKTVGLVTLESDVKAKTALNILSTNVEFGDGSTCGWDEAGSATMSQRYIEPAFLKVNMSFCDKNLLNKWASHQVQLAAGHETLPFEEKFIGDIVDGVDEKIEKLVWVGDADNDNEFDGYYTILAGENDTIKVQVVAGTSAYSAIKAVYAAIPASIVMKSDTVIFVSEGMYRTFIQELVAANLFHFNPDYKDGEYMLPGTSVKVIATSGLNGTAVSGLDKIVAGRLSNMFYGCGNDDDKDTVDLWYSKDNREFRLAIEFAAGVQVALPDEMVISVD